MKIQKIKIPVKESQEVLIRKVDTKTKHFITSYKLSENMPFLLQVLLVLALLLATLFVMYKSSIPKTYHLKVGDVVDQDIYSTRPLVNESQTQEKARLAAQDVKDVYVRNERISIDDINRLMRFNQIVYQVRQNLLILSLQEALKEDPNLENASYWNELVQKLLNNKVVRKEFLDTFHVEDLPFVEESLARTKEEDGKAIATSETKEEEVDKFTKEDKQDASSEVHYWEEVLSDVDWNTSYLSIDKVNDSLEAKLSEAQLPSLTKEKRKELLALPVSVMKLFSQRLIGYAQEITSVQVDPTDLSAALARKKSEVLSTNQVFYKNMYTIVFDVLQDVLRSNAVYDEATTEAARKASYNAVLANPILIEKGTRLLSQGEVVTKDRLQLLKNAGLLDEGKLDETTLAGLILIIILLTGVSIYALAGKQKMLHSARQRLLLVLTLALTFFLSAYIGNYVVDAPPLLFATIILATYYSSHEALSYSLLLALALFPMTGFDYRFLFVNIVGILVVASSVHHFLPRDRYAQLIGLSSFVPAFASFALDVMLKASWQNIFSHSVLYFSMGIFSSIAAIGSMPLYEFFLDALSPLRLIELSNQSQMLLRRLFNEATGTYHHSLMVAALSEVAAEAIGANAMLVRVGALYHDIGKLTNPLMFTENQEGDNPHDRLPPIESAKIILAHVEDGLVLAEKYRLPAPLLPFIREHHGTTQLQFFYNKAINQHAEAGLMPPDVSDYTYHGPRPQSKETAILMLADTVEAAMKSAGLKDLGASEIFIRKLINNKIEHQQLVDSHLTFNEVEKIIKAFLHVYAGQFHERVKYTDEIKHSTIQNNKNQKSSLSAQSSSPSGRTGK